MAGKRRPRKPLTLDASAQDVSDAEEVKTISPQENADAARANVSQQLGGLSDALTQYGGALVLLAIGAVVYFFGGDDGE